MMRFDVTRPWELLTLLALVPVVWLAASTRLRLSRGRFLASAASRFLAVAALALALAGLRHVRVSDDLAVVFILDRSRSVDPEDEKRALDWIRAEAAKAGPRETVGLVVFGTEASVEASPAGTLEVDRIRSIVAPEGTDIARALRLAAAACPDGAQKRLVLISDGNQTSGDAAEEALSARARGAEVWTVPLGREGRAEVRIDRVLAPTRVSPREPYEVTAIVTSSEDTEATFRILKNRTPLAPVTRSLKKGTWPVTFALKAREEDAGSALDFEVRLATGEGLDTWRENNVGLAHARVVGPPRILYLEGKEGESDALAGCLRDAGLNVDVAGPAGAPLSLAEMDAYDAILMSDIHSRQLSTAQQQALRQYVHDLGGGLLMLGGDASFGAGAWQRTPVEEALPVFMDVRQMKRLASLAVVVVIDNSGSMGAPVADGRQKIELAAEAACEIVRLMNDRDELAVATVDTAPNWILRLSKVDDRSKLADVVARLTVGGGGINCATGLRAGFKEMQKATASMRHLILFADAADADEHDGCETMIKEAVAADVTMSVVAIGSESDKDAVWLRQMAELGGGRFYITNDAMDLPRIFSEETVAAARSVILEEPFLPTLVRPGSILEGVPWEATPQLKGYVATVAKPTAEVHLEATQGDPLLAKWHHGLGRSLAWTSDAKARWAVDWLNWPGYRTLWPQSLRWTMRKAPASALSIATSLSGGDAHVAVDAVSASGRFRDFLKLRAFVAGPGGRSAQVPLRQTGPGRYEADFPAGETGSWFVTIAEEEEGGWAPRAGVPILIPYPAEYRFSSADLRLLRRLAEITGGRSIPLEPQPALFAHTAAPARLPRELWRELLFAALLLLFLDVCCRRLGVPDGLRRRWREFRDRKEAPRTPSAEEALVGHLRQVKERVHKPVLSEPVEAPEAKGPLPSADAVAAAEKQLAPPPAPVAPPAETKPAEEGGFLDRLKAAKKKAQR